MASSSVRRTYHHNLHVRGHKEEGTTTTPFDMVVLNDLDRIHLVEDLIDRFCRAKPARPEGLRRKVTIFELCSNSWKGAVQ